MDSSEHDSFMDKIERHGPWRIAVFVLVGAVGAVSVLLGFLGYVFAAGGLFLLWACCYFVLKWRETQRMAALHELLQAEIQASRNAMYAGVRRSDEDVWQSRANIDALAKTIKGLGDAVERLNWSSPN